MIERAGWRILDANFNRAREALRMIEEYGRFVLDHPGLSGRAKALRHQLCAAMGRLDADRLLACRDAAEDVGAGLAVQGQLRRADLQDCLRAACKRLPEALRVLAEVTQGHDADLAQVLERLRYEAYTLEKDMALAAGPGRLFGRVALYVVISTDLPAEALALTARCVAGGADCLQLRCKHIQDRPRLALSREFVRMCREGGAVSIINDRVDLAVASDADGVHLGLDDLPVAAARRLQHRPLIIGATTHNPAELAQACEEHPTYVAVGPAFATATKPDLPPAGLEYVRAAVDPLSVTGISHVAIGGIHLGNVDEVLHAGARTIAVCSAVAASRDPLGVCKALKERILCFRSSPSS
jgi:thiamine-phosphate pyrophosphorylase